MSSTVATLGIALATLVLIVLAITLYKVRRVHQMLYGVSTNDSVQQVYRQIEALHFLYRELAVQRPLPPLRGFAASPDFLREIVRSIRETQIQRVVELGSGASTIVAARSLELNGSGHLYSLDHDAKYAEKTRELLREQGLQDWATVIHAPLISHDIRGELYQWYSLKNLPEFAIDLLIVDGPPAATQKHARYPALPLLRSRLAKTGVVIADDTSRRDDAEVIVRWSEEHPDLIFAEQTCEKGCVKIESAADVDTATAEHNRYVADSLLQRMTTTRRC